MISGVFTSLAFLAFLAITAWAFARRNRSRFDEAAQLPLHEDPIPTPAAMQPLPACCCKEKS